MRRSSLTEQGDIPQKCSSNDVSDNSWWWLHADPCNYHFYTITIRILSIIFIPQTLQEDIKRINNSQGTFPLCSWRFLVLVIGLVKEEKLLLKSSNEENLLKLRTFEKGNITKLNSHILVNRSGCGYEQLCLLWGCLPCSLELQA